MRKKSTAKRFARALLSIAREEGIVGRLATELGSIEAVFKKTPAIYKVLLNPAYPRARKDSLIGEVSKGLGLSEYAKRFLNMLVDTRHISLLPDIVEAFNALEDDFSGRLRVAVESPVDLGPEITAEIREIIRKETGKEVILELKTNPVLLAGVVLRLRNTVLDGSLRKQLELLREKIAEGAA
jgi:F-type H+-transporting ATPase subunit delta